MEFNLFPPINTFKWTVNTHGYDTSGNRVVVNFISTYKLNSICEIIINQVQKANDFIYKWFWFVCTARRDMAAHSDDQNIATDYFPRSIFMFGASHGLITLDKGLMVS